MVRIPIDPKLESGKNMHMEKIGFMLAHSRRYHS